MIITIVGLGVIGGSYAKCLQPLNYTVYGIDINDITLKLAYDMGIIKKGALYNTDKSKELIKETDLLILCIYPNDIKDFIEKYKCYFKKDLIITDVTGIKTSFIDDIIDLLPTDVDFIFAHPMAGREKRGIEYSSNYIFKKANFIITPIERNKKENIEIIENLVYSLRFKNIKKVTPEEHDLIISFTSQLPHAIAVALINSDNLNVDTGSFTGDSYREFTRIANINEDLWSELFLGNKTNLICRIQEFEKELDKLKKALNDNNKDELKAIFKESSRRRELLE